MNGRAGLGQWFLVCLVLAGALLVAGCAAKKPAPIKVRVEAPNPFGPARPPQMLLIGGNRWRLLMVDRVLGDLSNGDYGAFTYCDRLVMEFKADSGPEELRDSVVHEIEHAMSRDEHGKCHNTYWNNKLESDGFPYYGHRGIYWSAPLWVEVIRENPALTEFLQR